MDLWWTLWVFGRIGSSLKMDSICQSWKLSFQVSQLKLKCKLEHVKMNIFMWSHGTAFMTLGESSVMYVQLVITEWPAPKSDNSPLAKRHFIHACFFRKLEFLFHFKKNKIFLGLEDILFFLCSTLHNIFQPSWSWYHSPGLMDVPLEFGVWWNDRVLVIDLYQTL